MIDNFRFARHPLRIDFLNCGRLCFRRSLQPSECVGTRLYVGARPACKARGFEFESRRYSLLFGDDLRSEGRSSLTFPAIRTLRSPGDEAMNIIIR